MRRITESKLKDLKAEGIKLFADGRRVAVGLQIPAKKEAPASPTAPAPAEPPPQSALIDLIRVQSETANIIAQYGETVAACVAEFTKPKPKKSWVCSVSRGQSGAIDTIDIKEV